MSKQRRWQEWVADLNQGVDASAMRKLFRGRDLSNETLLAREAIQNATDARVEEAGHLTVRFRFVELLGAERKQLVDQLALEDLKRIKRASTETGEVSNSILDELEDDLKPLRLMFVEDFATHGLYGHPKLFKRSHLYKAMYIIGSSAKESSSGGSYGFGKSALERASRIQSVLAHSVFAPHEGDPITERLIGFTWWQDYQGADSRHYRGRLSYADPVKTVASNAPMPYEGPEARELAQDLGFITRDSSDPRQRGTSFLVIDADIDPQQLLREVERWWWPALEEHRLNVEILLPDGAVLTPKPAQRPELQGFIKAFRIATGVQQVTDESQERLLSSAWRKRGPDELPGALAVTIQPVTELEEVGLDETSQLDDDDDSVGTSETDSSMTSRSRPVEVALVRGPRMVICYESYGPAHLNIQGAFVAAEWANPLLRETEPATHDQWTSKPTSDMPERATQVAADTLRRIRRSVNTLLSDLRPPRTETKASLPFLDKLLKNLLGTRSGPVRPESGAIEPISLTFPGGRPEPHVASKDALYLETVFEVRLGQHAPGDRCEVEVTAILKVSEDDSAGDVWPLTLDCIGFEDNGFERLDQATWRGSLSREMGILFAVRTDVYPSLWTVQLTPTVTRVSAWEALS